MKHGCLLLSLVLFVVSGCGRPKQHDPQFVGKWISGLPIGAVAQDTTSIGKEINNSVRQIQRARNASGAEGVRLEIRADGTFTMTVRFELDGLQKMVDKLDSRGVDTNDLKMPEPENAYEGTWHSEGEQVILTSDSFLPYANQLVTRERPAFGSLTSEYETRSPYLPLVLRSNGNLSRFPDDVRPGTHETGLDFRRESD